MKTKLEYQTEIRRLINSVDHRTGTDQFRAVIHKATILEKEFRIRYGHGSQATGKVFSED